MTLTGLRRTYSASIVRDSSSSTRSVQSLKHGICAPSNEAIFVLSTIENQLKVVTELIDRHFALAVSSKTVLSQHELGNLSPSASQLAIASNMKTMLVKQNAATRDTLRHLEKRLTQQMQQYRKTLSISLEEEASMNQPCVHVLCVELRNRVEELKQEILLREVNMPMRESVDRSPPATRVPVLQVPDLRESHGTVVFQSPAGQESPLAPEADFETELVALVALRDRLLRQLDEYSQFDELRRTS